MPADCSLLLGSGRRFPPVYYNEIVTRGGNRRPFTIVWAKVVGDFLIIFVIYRAIHDRMGDRFEPGR